MGDVHEGKLPASSFGGCVLRARSARSTCRGTIQIPRAPRGLRPRLRCVGPDLNRSKTVRLAHFVRSPAATCRVQTGPMQNLRLAYSPRAKRAVARGDRREPRAFLVACKMASPSCCTCGTFGPAGQLLPAERALASVAQQKVRGTGFEPADPYGTAPSTLRRWPGLATHARCLFAPDPIPPPIKGLSFRWWRSGVRHVNEVYCRL